MFALGATDRGFYRRGKVLALVFASRPTVISISFVVLVNQGPLLTLVSSWLLSPGLAFYGKQRSFAVL